MRKAVYRGLAVAVEAGVTVGVTVGVGVSGAGVGMAPWCGDGLEVVGTSPGIGAAVGTAGSNGVGNGVGVAVGVGVGGWSMAMSVVMSEPLGTGNPRQRSRMLPTTLGGGTFSKVFGSVESTSYSSFMREFSHSSRETVKSTGL